MAATLLAGCRETAQSISTKPLSTSSSSVMTTTLTPAPATTQVPAGSALALLATLPVKGRAPKAGYSRDRFGPAWADVDHNGCDTRNDVLNRDLTGVAHRSGTHDCVVTSGALADQYTGKTIQFKKSSATAVQIDHVVALSDAWQTGAKYWDDGRRKAFANDPLNLLATDGPTNEKKGDGDAASWLPPNRGFWCSYTARQVSVKSAWSLWVTQPEHDALANVLSGCSDTPAPAASTPPPAAASAEPSTTALPSTASPPSAQSSSTAGVVSFANCAAARAAGAAPIQRGQLGYSSALDKDGDGVACE